MDPLDLATRKIAECRRLLERLITSSESFDYPAAKRALEELQGMIRELRKAQAHLEENKARNRIVQVVDFSQPATPHISER
jgi:hypothetical protein